MCLLLGGLVLVLVLRRGTSHQPIVGEEVASSQGRRLASRTALDAGEEPADTDAGPEEAGQKMRDDEGGETVRCPISSGPPLVVEGKLYVITPEEELPEGVVSQAIERRVQVRGDQVILADVRPVGRGKLRLPGYGSLMMEWESGEGRASCTPIRLEPVAVVVGRIVPPEGEVSVGGCGTYDEADEEGNFYLEVEARPCEITVQRKDGAVTTYGDPVPVNAIPGTETEVLLQLPEEPGGGLGLRWAAIEEGWLVTGAFKGSPAAEAGIRPGDIIKQVDGHSVEGASLMEVPALTEGPAGSTVKLLVRSEGGVHEVDIERRYLDDPWEFWYHCEPGTNDCESGFVVKEGMELEF